MSINENMFKEYYVGRRGLYHNKNVVITSAFYDYVEYQDFGFNFDEFTIIIYYEDGSKMYHRLKGKQIKRSLKLYENKKI